MQNNDKRAKMANLSKTTRDHEVIRRWAEERGGKPAHVKRTGSKDDIGVLRIDFPGYSGEGTLEPISWEQFFEKFDERNLSLVYQEETAAGQRSNFNKIVSAETAEEREAEGRAERTGGRRAGAAGGRKAAARSRSRTSGPSGRAKRAATVSKSASSRKKTASASRRSASGPSSGTTKAAAKKTTKSAGRGTSRKRSASAKSSSGRSGSKRTPAKKTARRSR